MFRNRNEKKTRRYITDISDHEDFFNLKKHQMLVGGMSMIPQLKDIILEKIINNIAF